MKLTSDGSVKKSVLHIPEMDFYQNMIRILTGTLVDVGCGVYPPERVAEILASKVRAEAGPTMPAPGTDFMGSNILT